jgi:hypothetical protein
MQGHSTGLVFDKGIAQGIQVSSVHARARARYAATNRIVQTIASICTVSGRQSLALASPEKSDIDLSVLLPNIITHSLCEGDAADLAFDPKYMHARFRCHQIVPLLGFASTQHSLHSRRIPLPVGLAWTVHLSREHARGATKISRPVEDTVNSQLIKNRQFFTGSRQKPEIMQLLTGLNCRTIFLNLLALHLSGGESILFFLGIRTIYSKQKLPQENPRLDIPGHSSMQ